MQYAAVLFCECSSRRYANTIVVYCNDLTYIYLIMTSNLKYSVMRWNFKRQKLFEVLEKIQTKRIVLFSCLGFRIIFLFLLFLLV